MQLQEEDLPPSRRAVTPFSVIELAEPSPELRKGGVSRYRVIRDEPRIQVLRHVGLAASARMVGKPALVKVRVHLVVVRMDEPPPSDSRPA